MAVLLSGEAVHDFVQGAVAAAGDDELAAFGGRVVSDFGGMAGAGGFGEFGFDAAQGENAASSIEKAAARRAAVTGVGIVNQKRVVEFGDHSWFRCLPLVSQENHSI